MGLCRDVLESLRDALQDSGAETEAWGKRAAESDEMSKTERILLVRRALWRLTSSARHPLFQWQRQEAASILAMVAGVVRITASD